MHIYSVLCLPLVGLVSSLFTNKYPNGTAEHGKNGEHENDNSSQCRNYDEQQIIVTAIRAGLGVPQKPNRVV